MLPGRRLPRQQGGPMTCWPMTGWPMTGWPMTSFDSGRAKTGVGMFYIYTCLPVVCFACLPPHVCFPTMSASCCKVEPQEEEVSTAVPPQVNNNGDSICFFLLHVFCTGGDKSGAPGGCDESGAPPGKQQINSTDLYLVFSF